MTRRTNMHRVFAVLLMFALVFTSIIPQSVWAQVPTSQPSSGTVYPGDVITYRVAWANDTSEDQSVSVAMALHDGLEYLSGGLLDGNGCVNWDLGVQPAGASGTVELKAKVKPEASGTIEQKAAVTVGGETTDTDIIMYYVSSPVDVKLQASVVLTDGDLEAGQFEVGLEPLSVQYAITHNVTVTMPEVDEKDQIFTFEYTLNRPQASDIATYAFAGPEQGTFTLKSGESYVIEALPEGTTGLIYLTDVEGYGFSETQWNLTIGGAEDPDVNILVNVVQQPEQVPDTEPVEDFEEIVDLPSEDMEDADQVVDPETDIPDAESEQEDSFMDTLTGAVSSVSPLAGMLTARLLSSVQGAVLPATGTAGITSVVDHQSTMGLPDTAPVPDPAVSANDASGSVAFDLTYCYPGTYKYQLKETNAAAENMTYDTRVYEVEVLVEEGDDGKLEAYTTYLLNGAVVASAVFTNALAETPAEKPADPVEPTGSVSVTKTVDRSTAAAGDTVTYTITYRNDMNVATDIAIRDPFNAGLVFQSCSQVNGSGEFINGQVRWIAKDVQPGESGSVTVTARVADEASGVITNTAYVEAYNREVASEAVDVAVSTPVKAEGTVHLRADPKSGSSVDCDDVITYTIQYKNTGKAAADVKIRCKLPKGVVLADSHPEPDKENGRLYWTIADVKPGKTGTIEIEAYVSSKAAGSLNMIAYAQFGDSHEVTSNTLTHKVRQAGGLSVSVAVAGNAAEIDRDFQFQVVLSGTGAGEVSGRYGDMNFINGVANFMLSDGESARMYGVPEGLKYSVIQIDQNIDGYTTTGKNITGTIAANITAEASFLNTKNRMPGNEPADTNTGSLIVNTTVSGYGDTEKTWTFTVTSDPALNGTYGSMTFRNGKTEFTLKHGQSLAATGLPAGMQYTVTEAEANKDGYTTTSSNASGTIVKDKTTAVVFQNNKAEKDAETSKPSGGSDTSSDPGTSSTTGVLVITTSVTGLGDKNKTWTFTVETIPALNGTYGDRTFKDGKTAFTLTNGQSVKITNLPADMQFTVTEAEANQDGYTTTTSGAAGKIVAGKTLTASFVNDIPDDGKPSEDVPKTGDEFNIVLWVGLLAVAVLGLGVLGVIYVRRRKSDEEKN